MEGAKIEEALRQPLQPPVSQMADQGPSSPVQCSINNKGRARRANNDTATADPLSLAYARTTQPILVRTYLRPRLALTLPHFAFAGSPGY